MPSQNKLPARSRIKKRAEFVALQESGLKLYSKHVLVIISPTDLSYSRIGLVVTRKIDQRAVVRNKIKRRMREIFRALYPRLSKSFDILIIARRGAQERPLKDLRDEIEMTLKRERCLQA